MEGIGLEYDNIDNKSLKSWNIRSSNENMVSHRWIIF